ncbi:MAG: methyltransferase [Phycisphaeraceae bacterium]|nr:methyltransferase [Phycisphaeraceae bacterium]
MPSRTERYSIGGYDLDLSVSSGVFNPTTTTQRLADEVKIPAGATVLDLGCGVGPLAIVSALRGANPVFAVDIVPEAIELAKENIKRAGVADKVTALCGDLFEPVKDKKFDLIVNDVSGIADRVARLSPWYPDAVPTGGNDGTDVVLRMLETSPKHLKPNGALYFATSTLSDAAKIVRHAQKVFKDRVEQLSSYRFPFCPEFMQAINELRTLRDEGKVTFEERRSRYIWTLDLYRATTA